MSGSITFRHSNKRLYEKVSTDDTESIQYHLQGEYRVVRKLKRWSIFEPIMSKGESCSEFIGISDWDYQPDNNFLISKKEEFELRAAQEELGNIVPPLMEIDSTKVNQTTRVLRDQITQYYARSMRDRDATLHRITTTDSSSGSRRSPGKRVHDAQRKKRKKHEHVALSGITDRTRRAADVHNREFQADRGEDASVPCWTAKSKGRSKPVDLQPPDRHFTDEDSIKFLASGVDPEVEKLVSEGWIYSSPDPSCASMYFNPSNDRIFAAVAKTPSSNWEEEVAKPVTKALDEFAAAYEDAGRGSGGPKHPNVQAAGGGCASFGFSYGGGQSRPQNLCHSEKIERAFERFCATPEVKRLVSHINTAFAIFFPRHFTLYSFFEACLALVDGYIKTYHPSSKFTACSINTGPHARARWHNDFKNFYFGICAIVAFGSYNHRTGGHLLLKEPRLIIELAPGVVCFIPSAGITHKNSSLKADEVRRSLVFYLAGRLPRWIWQGHRAEDPDMNRYKQALGDQRWELGWRLFPTMQDLLAKDVDEDNQVVDDFLDLVINPSFNYEQLLVTRS